ncbi:MAG: iron-sulfur cluster assembly accessory protein [Rhodobacteraceae bacterium]|nr:MAG: iron-sulfur cluster assembly accessory protein [Paracoccaceae bacterium]|tara:strand:+ start:671 stop:997 length:327 start_codon:yes stop_codon:yes gene_type:complete
MKTPISLTPKAVEKIKNLVIHSGKYALKLDLKKGGCAGMEYSMQYVDAPEKNEEVIEFDGVKVIVAPLAQMYLFGTLIDYEDGILESGFKFKNPNVTEACGCGESIKF